MKYLRDFNYGRVSTTENGITLREFTIIAEDKNLEVSPGVFMDAWTFNGTIPGPTIRATEGDLVRIQFINNGTEPHTMHFHGIHASEMDGVFDNIAPGGRFTYEFIAEPFGVFPYHCHTLPLEEHISRGLYGVYIVDPKTPRPEADEMVMVMNGYDTDFDTENNFYTVNGIPFYYMHHSIPIEKDRLVRVYLVNMLEFDQINNFHLHANLFQLYRSGTSFTPNEYTDVVTFSQGERGILEFTYKYPGPYLFHAHKTEFAEKGWMGTFLVKEEQTEPDAIALSKGERASYPAELSNNENNNNSSTTESKTEDRQYIGTQFEGGS
jgi:FtsP/CotA-like multicopper oxidase with cupredoxin domain